MADVSREAKAITAEIQNITDLYLGTAQTKGEVKTRNLSLYDKSTYKRLMDYRVQQAIYERENALRQYGGNAFTDAEIKAITKECSSAVKESCKRYDTFVRNNATVDINDSKAKSSKVIPFNPMTGSQKNKLNNAINEATAAAVNTYSDTYLATASTKDNYENAITTTELATEIETTASANSKIKATSKNPFPTLMSQHNVNKMDTDEKVGTVSTSTVVSDKHNQFIRNASLDSTADGHGLVAAALAGGRLPSEDDFRAYMYAVADQQAYDGLYSKNADGSIYTPEQAAQVAAQNRSFIDSQILPAYLQLSQEAKDNNEALVLSSSGNAFGKKVPNDEVMANIRSRLAEQADQAYAELKASGKTLTPNNKADILQRLNNEAQVLAQEYNVDPSWVQNMGQAELNRMINVNPIPLEDSVNPDGSINSDGISSTSDGAGVTPGTNRYTPGNRTAVNGANKVAATVPTTNSNVAAYNHRTHVASDYVRTYKTFSGHDMVVTVSIPLSQDKEITRVIGAFQTVTYSIHNEKMPIRCIGDMNAKRYVFGPRTIAGTIILTVFDRHWMKEMLDSYNTMIKAQGERYFLADELPAFNLTISAANEYGHNAKLALYGVTLVNEGQVMSINDVYTENTYQFYATNIEYLEHVDRTTKSQKTSVNNIPIKGNTQQNTPSGESKKASSQQETITVPSTESFDPTSPSDILELIKDKDKLAAYIADMDKDAHKKAQNELQEIIDKRKAGQMTDEEAATAFNKWENTEAKRRYTLFHNKVYDPIVQGAIRDFENGKTTEKQFAAVKDTLIQQDSYFTLWQNVSDKTGEETDTARTEVGTTRMRGSTEGLSTSLTKDPAVWKYIKPKDTMTDTKPDNTSPETISTYTPPKFTGKGTAQAIYWMSDQLSESNAYTMALMTAQAQLMEQGYDSSRYTIVSKNYDKATHEYTIVIQPILNVTGGGHGGTF